MGFIKEPIGIHPCFIYRPDHFGSDQVSLRLRLFIVSATELQAIRAGERKALAFAEGYAEPVGLLTEEEFSLLGDTVLGNPMLEKWRDLQDQFKKAELSELATLTYDLDKWTREWREEWDPVISPSHLVRDFYSSWFQTHFVSEKSKTSSPFTGHIVELDPLTNTVLASILPGSIPRDNGGYPRLNEALPFWRDLVIFEFLAKKAKSRIRVILSPWIDDEMDALMDWEQSCVLPSIEGSISEYQDHPFCERPFQQVTVTCEGNISHCCWQMSADLTVGNILKSPVDEIWKSKACNEIRTSIMGGELHGLCANAPGCPHLTNTRNKTFSDLTQAQPRYVDLHLPNSLCNIGGKRPTTANPACIMCERSLPDYRFQDDSRFKVVLENLSSLLPELEWLHVQGTAEPFWHGQIFDVLKILKFQSSAHKIILTTTTNGTVFTPERQEEFLQVAPRSVLSLSIDAATPETYRRIRRLDMYETVLKHAQNFGRIRRRDGTSFFRVQNNINLYNVDEVVDMVRMAADLGADEIGLNATETRLPELMVTKENAWRFQRAQQWATEEAHHLNLKIVFLRPLDLKRGLDFKPFSSTGAQL